MIFEIFPAPMYELKCFDIYFVKVQSEILKGNPLNDSHIKTQVWLKPKKKSEGSALMLSLPGFTGHPLARLNFSKFSDNYVQDIDKLTSENKYPLMNHFIVDGWTFWGGSQYINSEGTGCFQDYIMEELLPAFLEVSKANPDRVIVSGSSSGGYGALSLASSEPERFYASIATAPDCFFEASLKSDLYAAANTIAEYGTKEKIKELHKTGGILKLKNGFSVLNAVGMLSCYLGHKSGFDFPIDSKTGKLNEKLWKKVLEHDPIQFLSKRSKAFSKVKHIYLAVGKKDEFHLHLGARQIHELLKSKKIKHSYTEFDAGHMDLHRFYDHMGEWLNKIL